MLQNSLRHAWRLCTHIHTKIRKQKVPSATHLLKQGNKRGKRENKKNKKYQNINKLNGFHSLYKSSANDTWDSPDTVHYLAGFRLE